VHTPAPLAIEATGLVKTFADDPGARPPRPRDPRRPGLRHPRTQRRRQDHRRTDTRHAAAARRRSGDRPRPRSAHRGARDPVPGQPHRPVRVRRRGPHRDTRTSSCWPGCWVTRARTPENGRTSCWPPSGSDAARRQVKRYSGGMRRRIDIAASIVVHPGPDLPRRADDRARPPQPQPGVGDRPRARRRRHHRGAHHPVPRGGRPARRPHRDHRPRAGDRRGHRRSAEVLGRLRRAARPAAATRGDVPRRRSCSRTAWPPIVHLESDPIALPPGSSTPTASPGRWAELANAGIAVTDFALGQPSLDEVFLALTGHPARPGRPRRTRRPPHEHHRPPPPPRRHLARTPTPTGARRWRGPRPAPRVRSRPR
jgi:hypothetical protein